MNQTSVDRTSLPAALLDLAKSHLRVRHTRDDALILQYLAQAIEQVERRCSINLNPASVIIVPAEDCCTPWSAPPVMRWRLPVNNVQTFTLLDADGVDHANDYGVEQADLNGAHAAYLVGSPFGAPDWTFEATVGVLYAPPHIPPFEPTDLAPAVLAAVLRLTGAYYENREAFGALTADDFLGELAAVWSPSA
jgi:Phage gp6-like head-tail connector protein